VVAGTDNYGRALRYGRRAITCHPSEPRAEFLQHSQARGRFGKPEVSVSRFFGCGLIGR
jgi:hypothetical protein